MTRTLLVAILAAGASQAAASPDPATTTTTTTTPDATTITVTTTVAAAEAKRPTLLAVEPQPGKCSGFGLLVPVFGISDRAPDRNNLNERRELRVTGPVQSGIGGGYYSALSDDRCTEDYIVDWEVFGFSEGLDPSTTFQVGVGGGLGLTVFGKFQFGIALGYDLIRREVIEAGGVSRTYSNGLLEWNDVIGCKHPGGDDWACRGRNFTWLLTFGITSGAGSSSNSKKDN